MEACTMVDILAANFSFHFGNKEYVIQISFAFS